MLGVQKAMEKALNKDGELLVLYIHDLKLSEATVISMTESGWLGGRASDELYDTIQREYLIQGNALIDHIKQLCQEQGVSCRGILRGGRLVILDHQHRQTQKRNHKTDRYPRQEIARFGAQKSAGSQTAEGAA